MDVPDRPPDRVTYGPIEFTGRGYWTWQDQPTLMQMAFGKHNWVPVERERMGRKRYDLWEDKSKPVPEVVVTMSKSALPIGRWYWIPEPRYQPAGAPPLPQRCVRDTLEDEMGYEAATAYIGHRPCEFGHQMS